MDLSFMSFESAAVDWLLIIYRKIELSIENGIISAVIPSVVKLFNSNRYGSWLDTSWTHLSLRTVGFTLLALSHFSMPLALDITIHQEPRSRGAMHNILTTLCSSQRSSQASNSRAMWQLAHLYSSLVCIHNMCKAAVQLKNVGVRPVLTHLLSHQLAHSLIYSFGSLSQFPWKRVEYMIRIRSDRCQHM